jgi:hypothetical protein
MSKLGRVKEDDDLIAGDAATRYRTESGSDRMLALNLRSHVSFASVESRIRSLPLPILYRVAIKFIFHSFTRLSFDTAS